MATINEPVKFGKITYFTKEEKEKELERAVMSCLLWEDTFYEYGVSIHDRISDLCQYASTDFIEKLAIKARHSMNLRHVPLLLICCLAKKQTLRKEIVNEVVSRPDELTELLAIYWKDGKCPISAQLKKGLALAFTKFNEYQLAKYNRAGKVKLRDVLFLVKPKSNNEEQREVWKRLVANTLKTPDTWEVSLSSGANKKETFERLLQENKLGYLALLRNLRNMSEAQVSEDLIKTALETLDSSKILPFRFIAAAKYAPKLEKSLESALLKNLSGKERLKGKTVILVDVSGSMISGLSSKSDMNRLDAACGVALICKELCEESVVFTFSDTLIRMPDRNGFSLSDKIKSQENECTHLWESVKELHTLENYDRIIIITDEQHNGKSLPVNPKGIGYILNVGTSANGIGFGNWTTISGFSESVIEYIQINEKEFNL